MRVNTVCKQDCPGRYPGCGANCKERIKEREANLERYRKNAEGVGISEVLADGLRRRKVWR